MPVESVSAPARSDQWGIRPEIVAALLLIAYLASTVGHIFNGNFSTGFDELANVSFIAQIQQCRCFPALNELRLLDPVTRKFTSAPSYLNHPASNYAALSIGLDITTSLRAFRLVNVLLTGGAMVLLFATLFRVVAEPLARIVDVVLVGTVPPIGQLAATVSNDNLAMLGGTLAMLGEARYLGRKTAGN